MKLFVKTLKGNHFQIQVKPQDTVCDVKKNIECVQGANVYPASQQMLIYQGKALSDGTTLEENKVAESSFIVVMLLKGLATPKSPVEASATSPTKLTDASLSAPTPKSVAAPKSLVAVSTPKSVPASRSLAEGSTPKSLPAPKSAEGSTLEPLPVPKSIAEASTSPSKPVTKASPRASVHVKLPKPKSPDEASTSPLTTATNLSPTASNPNMPAPTITPCLSELDIGDQETSNLVATNGLENTIQHILAMGGGMWDRDTVVTALHGALNNPEKAIDYLISGIPMQVEVPSPAHSVEARQPTNTSPVDQQTTQPASELSSRHNAGPLDFFPAEFLRLGYDAAPTGALDFLRNSEQFQVLRAIVRANPQVLQPMLQELGKQNPNLMRLIQEHQTEFHQLLNEPDEGRERNILQQFSDAIPQAIQVTPEEHAAIGRLEAMGFEQSTVLEAYFACHKNEDLTANYLLDHVHEFED